MVVGRMVRARGQEFMKTRDGQHDELASVDFIATAADARDQG